MTTGCHFMNVSWRLALAVALAGSAKCLASAFGMKSACRPVTDAGEPLDHEGASRESETPENLTKRKDDERFKFGSKITL